MKMNNTCYDAIIVGGGHNGLVAASYLAKAGKPVLLLEAQDALGGATTSVKPFPEYDANLSRYSYLVSLLPDQIVADLGINFKILGRSYRIRPRSLPRRFAGDQSEIAPRFGKGYVPATRQYFPS